MRVDELSADEGASHSLGQSRNRLNYGIDEPYTVGLLIVIGFVALLIGVALQLLRPPVQPLLSFFGLVSSLLAGFFVLGFALVLVYGSKRWKLDELSSMSDQLPLDGDEVVLDIGCGRGAFANPVALRLRGGCVVALDRWDSRHISGNNPGSLVRNARILGNGERILLVKGDPSSMPFRPMAFDVAVSGMALNRLAGKDALQLAIGETVTSLKEGGRVSFLVVGTSERYAEESRKAGVSSIEVAQLRLGLFPPASAITGRKPYSEKAQSVGIKT